MNAQSNQHRSISNTAFWCATGLLVLLAILLMVQIDRQWQRLSDMTQIMEEQAKDIRATRNSLRKLEATLRNGEYASGTNTASDNSQGAAITTGAFARAVAASDLPDYAEGDWLVRALGSNIKTITPLVSSDADASNIQSYVLETLLSRNPDTLEWSGLLAENWAVSKDGLTITFRLRRDIHFSDGTPMTSADVVFSFNFIMNEAIAAPRYRAYLSRIAEVKALGEYQVAFVFKEPYFDSLSLAGTMEILPKHFYQEYLKDPRSFNESRGLLMGSGPYRLKDPKSWTPDQGRIELERNSRYWGPVGGTFDRLTWQVIEHDSARLTAFRNGEVDVYGARPREYLKLKKDKNLQQRSQQFEYMSPTAGYSYIGWNQQSNGKPTVFADRRVRMAMTLLTDVDAVLNSIFLGYGTRAISPFTESSAQHDPSLNPIPYNLKKAQQLLAEAGFSDRNNDGVLQSPDGENFSFELTFAQTSEDTRRMVLLLRDIYARAGIDMRPKPTEWAIMIEDLEKKNFDAITLGWTSGVEIDIFQMFHSTQTMEGGDNFINYSNPALDKLIDAARAEVNEKKRMALWRQAENILVEDQPYTFLLRRKTLAFVDKRIKNLQQTGLGLNLSAVPVEIFVPTDLQRKR